MSFRASGKGVSKSELRELLGILADGTLTVAERFQRKIEEGKAFAVSHRFEGLATNASAELYFENPSGSGRTVYIVIVEVVGMAQGWVDIYRGNTVSTPGTPLTPMNLNLGSTNASVVNVEYGGVYVAGTLALNTVLPGGNLVRAVGSAVEVGETVKIPEGNNILVRATNTSASAQDLSIRVLWWEE